MLPQEEIFGPVLAAMAKHSFDERSKIISISNSIVPNPNVLFGAIC